MDKEKKEENDCIFCKIAKGELSSKKIYEDDNFFAIYDINPIAKCHTLVIPKKHFETILDMPNTLERIEAYLIDLKELSAPNRRMIYKDLAGNLASIYTVMGTDND